MIEKKEVELKLELPPDCIASFRDVAALGDPERRPVKQRTTYFDTPEGQLRRAGYSLRLRRKGRSYVQTVKHRGGDSGGFSSRAEWEQRIAGPELDFAALRTTPVGELLTKRDARKRLGIASETIVQRTTWVLRRGRASIELILDEGEVVSGERREEICEIELELKKGRPEALFALALEIAQHVPLRMGVASKSERGVRLLEGRSKRVRKSEPVRLSRDMTIADAFAAIVQACLRHYRLNETILLRERNAAALHQARVAVRRLRSALTLFRPVLAGEEYGRLRAGLRSLAETLGRARNLDVLLAGYAAQGRPEGELAQVHKELRRARKEAYARAQAALQSGSLPLMILDIVAWAEAGEWRKDPRASQPVPEFAAARIDRGWRRVRKGGADIAGLAPEERHRLRIEIKKLRYAAEFFASLGAKERRPEQRAFIDRLEAMQESLGRLNDIETARDIAPDLLAVEEQPGEAEALIAEAQASHAALREAGRYWR